MEAQFFQVYNRDMPYLIDGHNLIPHVGLSLDAAEDELQLVDLLREFCRLGRQKVEVYFDGAPPGQDGTRQFGAVRAHFVRLGSSADAAIISRLRSMGNAARNWTVVSSDRVIRREARAARAHVLTSQAFAQRLFETLSAKRTPVAGEDVALSPEEVDEWLRLFGERGNKFGEF